MLSINHVSKYHLSVMTNISIIFYYEDLCEYIKAETVIVKIIFKSHKRCQYNIYLVLYHYNRKK